MQSDTTMPTDTTFDPAKYLTRISGSDYLEVKWRLVWLRSRHPDAAIETEMVREDGASALFRARVTIPGGGSATGWGSETFNDFGDYIEKSETKALGRALAALGFGTQFCRDHEFGADAGRVVDSPVGRPGAGGYTTARSTSDPATERQVKAIYAIGRAGGHEDWQVEALCEERYGSGPAALSRRDASAFIDTLNTTKGTGNVTR